MPTIKEYLLTYYLCTVESTGCIGELNLGPFTFETSALTHVTTWHLFSLYVICLLVARRFVSDYGVARLSIGEAIRWVLCNESNTHLAQMIQTALLNGLTVPDDLAVQALEIMLLTKQCRTRGYSI